MSQNQTGSCILAFSTLTFAMKGEEALRMRGIFTRTVRLSPERTKKGCGYGLEMDCKLAAAARQLLKNAGIPFGELLA